MFKALVRNLSDFFGVFQSSIVSEPHLWFRGHSSKLWTLTPSALRYAEEERRQKALDLVRDLRRYLSARLPRSPEPDEHLAWAQVAQHHGLPTRLLDWTQNAAVALYFACVGEPDEDGAVVMLNPIELNGSIEPTDPRLFYDDERDRARIKSYLDLDGRLNAKHGKPTIAIHPTWNNDRIALQHGSFTLHGSRNFTLDESQASSLLYVPILREYKQGLRTELERVGISEMFIFPEPEHVCLHLKRNAGL